MQRPRAAFRPDVEGLRGLAVLLVVFYHLKVPGFSGGFAGVDIFFVLSGFLITRLLLKEGEQSGRIDLPSFFARRVRRLLPMLAVVVACTGFLSRALLPSSDWEGIGQDIAWSSVWLANWNLMQKGVDYLGGSLLPSPLQHLWSLAVEEQFYLCWPLFLAGGWRIFGRSVARAEVFLWTLLSLAYARWLGQQSPAVAFFSSPARAWELGLGALLVFAPPAPARRWLGWLGLVGIVGSVISFGEQTPWPFPGALLPTIGTALVIFADAEEPLLSSGPMPWFGTLSYSWYLWHWPMLCFASILQTSAWTLATLSLLLAWASHRWIETPLRTSSLFQGSPYRNLTIGLLTSLTLLTGGRLLASAEKIDETPLQAHRIGPGQYQIDAGLTVDLNHNLVTVAPDRPPDRPSEARRRPTFAASQGCSPETWTSPFTPCQTGKADARFTVALLGDSHATNWIAPLSLLADLNDWRLFSFVRSACPIAQRTVWDGLLRAPNLLCDRWHEEVLPALTALHPDLLLATERSGFYEIVEEGQPRSVSDSVEELNETTVQTLVSLRSSAGAVIWLRDTPIATRVVPECLELGPDRCVPMADLPTDDAGLLSRLRAQQIPILDLSPALCETTPCPVEQNGLIRYRDNSHFTDAYAYSLAPALQNGLLPLLPTKGRPDHPRDNL